MIVDARISQIYMYNLKMSELVKPSAEYDQRAAIIEALFAGRSSTEIIWFFGYPRSIVCDIVQKYADAEKSEKDSANPQGKVIRERRLQGHWLSFKELKSSFQKTQECRFGNCPSNWGWIRLSCVESLKRTWDILCSRYKCCLKLPRSKELPAAICFFVRWSTKSGFFWQDFYC